MRVLQHVFSGRVVLGMAAVLMMSGSVVRAQTDELPGNLFHQYNAAIDPNPVGLVINNPQNMGGGQWVGGTNYPVGGNSPVLDGIGTTAGSIWSAGTFGGGGMCNVGITQGKYSTDQSAFTNVAFGAIDTIRIWVQNWQNSDLSWWISYPQQIKIAYRTTAFGPGDGYSYNSGTLGVMPGTWNIDAPITAVNGGAPAALTNTAYTSPETWVDLTGKFTQGVTVVNPGHDTAAYVDLSVAIPAGATSIGISFGQDNASTGHPGGLFIGDIQAALLGPPNGTWRVNASSDWNLASNWTEVNGRVPNGAGSVATLGGAITSPHYIGTDTEIVLKGLTFDNAKSYSIVGAYPTGMLTMSADTGSAFIQVNDLTGGTAAVTHNINLPVEFASDTTINVDGSLTTLLVSNPVTIDAGRTVTKTGSGGLSITSTIGGGGTLGVSGAGSTLVLSPVSPNSYAGGTNVSDGGTLVAANADALPTGRSLTIASGGHVVLASGLSHAISLGGLTITSGAGGGQSPAFSSPPPAVGGSAVAAGATTPTPEPGTLILLAAGALAGLAAWRRRHAN